MKGIGSSSQPVSVDPGLSVANSGKLRGSPTTPDQSVFWCWGLYFRYELDHQRSRHLGTEIVLESDGEFTTRPTTPFDDHECPAGLMILRSNLKTLVGIVFSPRLPFQTGSDTTWKNNCIGRKTARNCWSIAFCNYKLHVQFPSAARNIFERCYVGWFRVSANPLTIREYEYDFDLPTA